MRSLKYFYLGLALLIMFGIAAAKLNADILFTDEYYSIRVSGGIFGPLDLRGIWERTINFDYGGMGVLYYALLGTWERFTGNSPFAVRYFSLLSGLLALVTTYQLGRKIFSNLVGIYTALILASSAFFIDYLHEGRAYTLLVYFAAFSLYCYVQILLSHRPRWLWYLCLILALAASAYTHYVGLSMAVVLSVIHLLYFHRTRRWAFMSLAMAIACLLYLPWINITLEIIRRGVADTGRQSVALGTWQILESIAHSFSNANIALFLLLAVFSLYEWNKKVLIVWIYGVVGLIMVLLVNSVIPFMLHIRYLIFIFPALAMIMALGAKNMQRSGKFAVAVWLVVGLYQAVSGDFISSLYGHIYRAPAAGFQTALKTLDERAEEGDMALFHIIQPGDEHLNYFPLAYYLEFPPLDRLHLAYEQFERFDESQANGDNDYLLDVNRILAPIEAVWTMQIPELPSTQKTGVVNYVLATQFIHCETVFEREDMLMALYVRPPQEPALAAFADNKLELFDMNRGYQTSDESHWILSWFSNELNIDTYSIGLHLYDAAGNFVSQTDLPLPNQRPYSCLGVSIPLENLPSGTYQLYALVYNWQTAERLTTDTGDSILLGTIVIP